jgi:hypothetical protein
MNKVFTAAIAFVALGAVPALAVGPYDPADSSMSSSVNSPPLNKVQTQSANQAGPQTQPQAQVLQPQLAAHQQGAQQVNPANRGAQQGGVRY